MRNAASKTICLPCGCLRPLKDSHELSEAWLRRCAASSFFLAPPRTRPSFPIQLNPDLHRFFQRFVPYRMTGIMLDEPVCREIAISVRGACRKFVMLSPPWWSARHQNPADLAVNKLLPSCNDLLHLHEKQGAASFRDGVRRLSKCLAQSLSDAMTENIKQ